MLHGPSKLKSRCVDLAAFLHKVVLRQPDAGALWPSARGPAAVPAAVAAGPWTQASSPLRRHRWGSAPGQRERRRGLCGSLLGGNRRPGSCALRSRGLSSYMRNPRSPGRHAGWKRLGTYCNPLGVILVCAILWIGLIWPIRVENRIGKRKGRRGWIYPVVGFFAGLGGLGAWPSTTPWHWRGAPVRDGVSSVGGSAAVPSSCSSCRGRPFGRPLPSWAGAERHG